MRSPRRPTAENAVVSTLPLPRRRVGIAPSQALRRSSLTLAGAAFVIYLWVIHSFKASLGAPAIVLGLIGIGLQRERLRFPAPLIWFGAFVVWAAIGYSVAEFPDLAKTMIWGYVKVWLIFLLALNLAQTKQQLRLMIIAFLGIYAFYPVRGILFNFLNGIQIQGRYAWNVIFSNPNDYATLTLPLLAMSVALLQSEKQRWAKYCALAGTIVLPLCIVITESRGGILALFTFGTLVLFQYRKRIGSILVILMVVAGISQLAPQSVWDRMGGLKNVMSEETIGEADPYGSAKQRYDIWRVSRAIIMDHPVLGIGPGNYPDIHFKYALTGRFPGFVVHRRDPHSTYFHAAAEDGIPGLLLFLGVVFSTFIAGFKAVSRLKGSDPDTARSLQTMLFGLIAFLQASIFASMEFLPHMYLFLAIICTTIALNPTRDQQQATTPRIGLSGWTIFGNPGSTRTAPFTPTQRGNHACAMCGAIQHRGPDGEGYFAGDSVALGMRRLSIIDLVSGQQPIANEDGRIQVVFNGEIYNHRVLRAELVREGHQFRTRADTEVIVHGYEQWGDQVLGHLRGMFAIALWDRERKRLLLARDRLGIKPLYLWEREGGIAFASELKCFEALPGVAPAIDAQAVLQYLSFGYVPDASCIWQGVRKLAPGHALSWTAGEGVKEWQWWSPVVAEARGIEREEAVREVRRLLEDSVACHLESDVPLGAFLSGGVDSSAVVAQMARLMDRRVQTFSIGFDDPGFNEAPDAALVAKAIGTDHVERILHPDVDTLLDDLLLWFDEPFADASALPTWLVSRLARERVTVALSGDGGDEMFGGYTRYQEVQRLGLRAPAIRRMVGALARQLPHGVYGRGFLLNLSRSTQGRYASTVGLPALPAEGGVVRPEVAGANAELEALLRDAFARTEGRDLGSQLTLVDVLSYLPGDILTKVDRMSMKVSLEARVPLLDHELAEFALSLPGSFKFQNGSSKWVFREAVKDLVPAAVLTKPKQGFGVPIAGWLLGPLKHRLDRLSDPASPIYAFCDERAVSRLLAEHRSQRRDHNTQLWRLIVLDLWLRRHRS